MAVASLTGRNENAPVALKAHYGLLTAVVRGMSRCLRSRSGRRYWVGKEVLEEVTRGAALVGIEDMTAVTALAADVAG